MSKNATNIRAESLPADDAKQEREPSIVSRIGAGISAATTGIRSLFSAKRKPKHQRLRRLGMENLEGRALLSTFSSMSTLGAQEVVWSQGKDDANGTLGVENILPGSNLYDIKASPDGTKIITSGQFKKSSVVNAKTGVTLLSVTGHNDSVIDAAWSPDGSGFFTASYDRHVRQFAADGTLMWDSGDVGQLGVGVDVSPDGGTLFIRRHEAPPMIVDVATKTVRALPDSMKMIGDMDALEDGNLLLLQNDWERLRGPKNRVFIVDAATGGITWEGSLSGKQPTNAAATPNGQFVFAGIDDGSIVMFDRIKGASSMIAGGSSYLRDMTMDASGTMLVVGTEGGLRVYDVEPLMTGNGSIGEPFVFPVPSSSVSVSGSVAFVNNTADGSRSRTIAVDLGKVPNVLKRLIAKETAVSPKAESGAPVVVREIMVEENVTIDLASMLPHGNFPPQYTTTIDGIGSVTFFGDAGVAVNDSGVSCLRQPSGGTGFAMRFNDGRVTLVSANFHFSGTNPKGFVRLQRDGDYIRKNGVIFTQNLTSSVDFEGTEAELIDWAQNSGLVGLQSITVNMLVKKTVFDDPVLSEKDSAAFMEQASLIVSEIESLAQPWNMDDANRMASLTERTSALHDASMNLLASMKVVASLDDAVSDEQKSALEQALQSAGEKLLVSMQERDLVEEALWETGLSDISADLQQELITKLGSVDNLRLLTTALDLSGVTRAFDGGSIVRDALEVLDAGGTINFHGLQGRAITPLSQQRGVLNGETVVTENGQALVVDFSSLSSPVVRTDFVVTSSLEADIVKVSFLSGSGVSEVRMVDSGERVSYEDADDITGVMIENVQSSGQSHAVSISELSVTSNMGETQEVSMLSSTTNALYATMSVPEVQSVWFPNNRFANITPVGYNKDAYNAYSVKRFSGAAGTIGIPTYVNAADEPRQLPKEFYAMIGDSLVVFPSGQDLRIGIGVNSGERYSSSLPVGKSYDYEILTKAGASLADVLPSNEARVGVNDVTLFTVNQGGDAGWHEGASLEYSTASPVAVGSIKARARIENIGGSSVGFTVKVSSGNVGTPGWDRVQYSYKGSLASGDSRALVTDPVSLNTDNQGRSFIRFVVVADDGRILAEGGRTVGAGGGVMSQEDQHQKTADFMKNWEAAMVKAQAETKAFFASRGETVPTMGDPATLAARILAENVATIPLPDAATTERQMRLAFRALDAARASGNTDRIALEQSRFDKALSAHTEVISMIMAMPGAGAAQKVPDIVRGEETAWKTVSGALEQVERKLAVVRGELLASVDGLTELRIGGLQIEDKGNITLEKVGENLWKLTTQQNEAVVGKTGIAMNAGMPSVIELTITEDTMVSMGNVGRFGRNVNLTISGGSLPQEGYSSTKGEGFGDSVSLKLTPGTYEVTLSDITKYNDQIHSQLQGVPFTAEVEFDVQPYHSASIHGLISVEGSRKIMPVSMRVAEFDSDTGKRKENYEAASGAEAISKLDPTKPVWVVVHGMNSDEKGGMEQIARELAQYDSNIYGQVVTIDWSVAADTITTKDAPWAKSVGEWVARRLVAAGFQPHQINIVGHSHGTYVGYALANEIVNLSPAKKQINTLVALDPAGNIPAISGFKVGSMNFANISSNSIAIEGSWMLGNDSLASTADVALKIDSDDTWPIEVLKEHSLPVSTFANLLKKGRSVTDSLPLNLLLQEMMKSAENQTLDVEKDIDGKYEGIIEIAVRNAVDAYGKKYSEALIDKIMEKIGDDRDLKIWDVLNDELFLQQG